MVPVAATSSNGLAERIDQYIEGKVSNSPLVGHGKDFVRWGNEYGVDPRLLVAISGAESHFGTTGDAQNISKHNAWGIGPGWTLGPSWEHGIRAAARLLGENYRTRQSVAEVGAKWCPVGASNDPGGLNSHWVGNVSDYYSELGGDPSRGLFTQPGKSSEVVEEAPIVVGYPLKDGMKNQSRASNESTEFSWTAVFILGLVMLGIGSTQIKFIPVKDS